MCHATSDAIGEQANTRSDRVPDTAEDLEGIGGRVSLDAEMTDSWRAEVRMTVRRDRSAGPIYDPIDPNFIARAG